MIEKDFSRTPYKRQEQQSVVVAESIEDEVTVTVPAEDRIGWNISYDIEPAMVYIVLITHLRVEYGRIFHERYFHEPKASVNIRVSGHITQ